MSYVTHLGSLEDKFRHLDELPEELYSTIVTHSHGDLNRRIQGILQWRDAFLNGRLPEEERLSWPEQSLRRMVLKRLEVLDIVRYCQDQPELTDNVLKDVCAAISSAEQWQQFDSGFDDPLARQQKRRKQDSPFRELENQGPDNQTPASEAPGLSESSEAAQSTEPGESLLSQASGVPEIAEPEFLQQIDGESETARQTAGQQALIVSEHFPENENPILERHWQELAQQWRELESVFSEISGFLGRGWDLTQGLLASQGWRDIIRYRRLVQDLPWLQQVIAALGRLKEKSAEQQESISEQVIEPVKRLVDEEVDVRTPRAVYETSGIRRSDDISRLLPGELAQLGHPQLNLLWHAKRAEHTLLTYQVDGVLSEHEPVEREELEEFTRTRPEQEKGYGPIIVCLDSSASMQGEAENIAKALVLEALRIAWQEQRACYVYLFSGPEQQLRHDLDLSSGGLAELLAFLTQSFHGGTDIIGPLMQALVQQQQENWQEADILLVTDGRFPVTQQQLQQIKAMRKHSQTRIHGVVIGNWQGSTMQTICDNFHRIAQST